MPLKKIRILGLDPGLATTGFGLIEVRHKELGLIDFGTITTNPGEPIEKRLLTIFKKTSLLVEKTRPDAIGVEELFFYKNQKTAIAVGQAKGAILVACAQWKQKIFYLSPLQVKLNLTGYGKADKKQIKKMVELELKTRESIKPDDAADAVAVAMCAYFIHIRHNAHT